MIGTEEKLDLLDKLAAQEKQLEEDVPSILNLFGSYLDALELEAMGRIEHLPLLSGEEKGLCKTRTAWLYDTFRDLAVLQRRVNRLLIEHADELRERATQVWALADPPARPGWFRRLRGILRKRKNNMGDA